MFKVLMTESAACGSACVKLWTAAVLVRWLAELPADHLVEDPLAHPTIGSGCVVGCCVMLYRHYKTFV